MNTQTLQKHFEAIGAKAEISSSQWLGMPRLDVRSDKHGETFTITFPAVAELERARRFRRAQIVQEPTQVNIEVIDSDVKDRHLLLLVRDGQNKSKFLCGHDERHWFVAAIPENAGGVTGVQTAKAALQPLDVRDRASRLKKKDRNSRKNEAFIRQGEWFFIPVDIEVDEKLIIHNEPLTRDARSKPHMLGEAYRSGGTTVYVSSHHPQGISEKTWGNLSEGERVGFRRMVKDPELYVRGTVRHSDHATIILKGWHRVVMNTEQQARAMRHVAFLD